MNISRRIAIKNLLFVTAGAALLPSCLDQPTSGASISLKNLKISKDQEDALASVTETIIPTTDTPGAKDISAHLFVLKMVDDCYTDAEQKLFVNGFEGFNQLVESKYKRPFPKCTAKEKEELLTALEGGKDIAEDVLSFYKSTKGLTLFGYTTSQYYMTKVKGYNIIPGK